MWRDRGLRRGVAVLAALAALGLPSVPAAAAFDPPCASFAMSPAFATDRTAVCTYVVEDAGHKRLAVARTTDAGRSWRSLAATGLTSRGERVVPFTPVFSPRFAEDRTLIVGTDTGLHVSRDAGATWSVVDPLVRSGTRTNPAPFVASSPLALPGEPPHLYAAYAGAERTARIDVTRGVHEPATGTPGGSTAAFVPTRRAGSTSEWEVVALGASASAVGDPPAQYSLYRCTIELNCAVPLHTFAPSNAAQVWALPGGVLAVALVRYGDVKGNGRAIELWRSTDGGSTFRRWDSVTPFLAESLGVLTNGTPTMALAAHHALPRRLYLRIETPFWYPSNVTLPTVQIWRSDDAGASWTRVGYRRHRVQKGARGTLPFDGTGPASAWESLHLAADGRVFAVGREVSVPDRPLRSGMFCSVDGGRRWARFCPR